MSEDGSGEWAVGSSSSERAERTVRSDDHNYLPTCLLRYLALPSSIDRSIELFITMAVTVTDAGCGRLACGWHVGEGRFVACVAD